MDAAIIVALIALAATVANVGLTYSLNARSERRRELERSDARWGRYQASLALAAEELSSRIENILDRAFLDAYARGAYSDEAIRSTLFRFAQFFGWSEILRRYARDPDPRHLQQVQTAQDLQRRVGKTFNTDDYGAGGFMLWREAQRAVGELMIIREGDVVDTKGVAGFVSDLDRFRPWISRVEAIVAREVSDWDPGERERLQDVRAALDVLAADLKPSPRPQSHR
jgi:hypothetical protein